MKPELKSLASIAWLAVKVFAFMVLSNGDVAAFIYQNF